MQARCAIELAGRHCCGASWAVCRSKMQNETFQIGHSLHTKGATISWSPSVRFALAPNNLISSGMPRNIRLSAFVTTHASRLLDQTIQVLASLVSMRLPAH